MSEARPQAPARERLFSLDLLRGLDMFLLTVVGTFVAALSRTVALPEGFCRQFYHEWGCFRLWDIIMPLFIFMCGAAVPFALGRRLKAGCSQREYWWHVFKRVALLWFLGAIAQGRLLTLDPLEISPFDNTLQAIASGYLIAAAVILIPSRRIRLAVPFVLALVYALLLHFGGDYTLEGNFAQRVENWVVPLLTPAGSHVLAKADPGYTWWLTVLMFGAMTLCGMEATNILLAQADRRVRFWRLFALGAALLAAGWALVGVIPSIKHIYTLTFTAQAMGWSCLALALLYLLTDILGWRRGLGLFILFGKNALLCYMAIEVFRGVFWKFGEFVAQGVPHWLGEKSQPLAVWFAASVLLVVVLHFRSAARRRDAVADERKTAHAE